MESWKTIFADLLSVTKTLIHSISCDTQGHHAENLINKAWCVSGHRLEAPCCCYEGSGFVLQCSAVFRLAFTHCCFSRISLCCYFWSLWLVKPPCNTEVELLCVCVWEKERVNTSFIFVIIIMLSCSTHQYVILETYNFSVAPSSFSISLSLCLSLTYPYIYASKLIYLMSCMQ